MNKIQIWLQAARLRTLPLSLSGVIVGAAIAKSSGFGNSLIFLLALLTTVAFQVTSNFANDYGDGIKGTDNADRIGPERTLQSGLLSKTSLKRGIVIAVVISLFLSILLLLQAFGIKNLGLFSLFFVFAILSVWAAIKYTMGNNAYGYRGLGDVFVFLFFGILAVLGTEFLFTKTFNWLSLFPAAAVGLLSTAVLNLNNLRDHGQDKKHGKNTLVVKLGFGYGKTYHYLLLGVALVCMLAFHVLGNFSLNGAFYFLAFIPVVVHAFKLRGINDPKQIDPELKKIALSTFFMSILFYFSVNYF